MAELTLRFSETSGEVKVEANGFVGPACESAMYFLRETLGECIDFQHKAEWFEENIALGFDTNLCG